MITILQWIEEIERKYVSEIAFQYVEGETVKQITFAEYVTDIKRFASYLRKEFRQPEGIHFGILAKNSYHYAVALFGILLAKGVVVPLNFEETPDTIQYETDHADVAYLFTDGTYERREQNLSEFLEPRNCRSLEAYQTCETIDTFTEEYDVNQLAILMYTSGTTGRNKAVILSQKTLFAPLQGFSKVISGDGNGLGLFCIVPFYHISGLQSCILSNTIGASTNLCTQLKYMYRDLSKMRSTYTLVVPMVLNAWAKEVKRGNVEKLGGLQMILCGAAAADEGSLEAFGAFGITVLQAYALTEICGGGTINLSTDRAKLKSVGRPMQGCELKIVDGEVCLKSEALFCGYYKEPEKTNEVIKDGWLYTGDLGYLDADGDLFLTGRKKNLIILSGGENVSPEELEQLILEQTSAQEVLVEGDKDKLCAKVVCRPEEQARIEEEITVLNRKLAFYKRIAKIEFLQEALPKTSTGKIARK